MSNVRPPRRVRFGPFILVGTAVALVAGFVFFGNGAFRRAEDAHAVRIAPSRLFAELRIDHGRGPLAREIFVLENRSGLSHASYRAEGRSGTAVEVITPPARAYDVTFAWEALVSHGAWQIVDRPARGDVTTAYRFTIAQTAQGRSGTRIVTFTDPHYWAVLAGREYHLHLAKDRPLPDLVRLTGTTRADPRYERIVRDFSTFGDAEFRADVAHARKRAEQ